LGVRRLLPLVVLAIALTPAAPAAAASCPGEDLVPSSSNISQVKHATLCLLNRERAALGLRKLKTSAPLARAARRYSATMVRDDFFDHVSPSGSTLVERIRKTSYLSDAGSFALGENLAWGTGYLATPAKTMEGWMNSPGHKANVLQPRFREIGIGIALGAPSAGSADGATYTTAFGHRVRR
jgi:uncharacterized protein YkwD